MTAAEKQTLRVAVLKVLDANPSKQFGLNLSGITIRLTPLGFPAVTQPEVEAVMGLLEEEGMIGKLADRMTPGVAVWRITDEGRSYLAEKF